jgi:hypothetical protein
LHAMPACRTGRGRGARLAGRAGGGAPGSVDPWVCHAHDMQLAVPFQALACARPCRGLFPGALPVLCCRSLPSWGVCVMPAGLRREMAAMLLQTGRRAVPCCGRWPLCPNTCPTPFCLLVSCVVLPGGLRQEISDEVMAAARQLQEQHADDVPGLTAPAAVVHCSAITGGRRGWRYA